MQITSGKIAGAQKIVIYGPEGVGKSTFASQFPNPLFIDTEGSTDQLDVNRLPRPSSWQMIKQEVEYVRDTPHLCGTLVIDTADWAERLCIDYICATVAHDKNKPISGIEDYGYGKGYTYVMEEFGRLLNLLEEVAKRGINLCITAHGKPRKFELPEEMGAYDRWEMKLSKNVAPLLKEWADAVFFANYKIHVVNVDGQGAQKGKNKAQGGARILYTTHHTCWDAKNRFGLPDELPFDYSAIAHCIPMLGTPSAQPPIPTENSFKPIVDEAQKTILAYAENAIKAMPDQPPAQVRQAESAISVIPKALQDLMELDHVAIQEIQQIAAIRGHYPIDTPIEKYDPKYLPFIAASWKQVLAAVKEARRVRAEDPFEHVKEN